MELQKVQESELAEVSAFLCAVFGLEQPGRNLQPDVLRWKYFAPHPFWEGSRSYCLRHNGEIAAHACVAPTRLTAGSRTATSCAVIDWAGSPKVTGAGSLIYRLLYPSVDTFLGIGGSAPARKVLPRLGFEMRGELEVFTRVVRPLADFARRPKLSWRSGAHLARNTVRWLRAGAGTPGGWSARRVEQFDASVDEALPVASDGVVCRRTPELLNYLLECPAARMEGYTLHAGAALRGYCLLSHVESQCRIADVWCDDLNAAYALALEVAADRAGVAEVIAAGSTPRVVQAIAAAGFHRREGMPIFWRDTQRLFDGCGPIGITPVENDFFYL